MEVAAGSGAEGAGAVFTMSACRTPLARCSNCKRVLRVSKGEVRMAPVIRAKKPAAAYANVCLFKSKGGRSALTGLLAGVEGGGAGAGALGGLAATCESAPLLAADMRSASDHKSVSGMDRTRRRTSVQCTHCRIRIFLFGFTSRFRAFALSRSQPVCCVCVCCRASSGLISQ